MIDPSWAVQTAVFLKLTSAPAVLAELGGPHVYDHVPRGTPRPYVTFATSVLRDVSTSSGEAHEHVLTLSVWADARGRKKVAAIMQVLRESLRDAALTLTDHHLVGIDHQASEIRRDADGERLIGQVRFRAVTEPL